MQFYTAHVSHAVNVSSIKISKGNRTQWSSIRSVIVRVITKSEDRAAGVTGIITDRI